MFLNHFIIFLISIILFSVSLIFDNTGSLVKSLLFGVFVGLVLFFYLVKVVFSKVYNFVYLALGAFLIGLATYKLNQPHSGFVSGDFPQNQIINELGIIRPVENNSVAGLLGIISIVFLICFYVLYSFKKDIPDSRTLHNSSLLFRGLFISVLFAILASSFSVLYQESFNRDIDSQKLQRDTYINQLDENDIFFIKACNFEAKRQLGYIYMSQKLKNSHNGYPTKLDNIKTEINIGNQFKKIDSMGLINWVDSTFKAFPELQESICEINKYNTGVIYGQASDYISPDIRLQQIFLTDNSEIQKVDKGKTLEKINQIIINYRDYSKFNIAELYFYWILVFCIGGVLVLIPLSNWTNLRIKGLLTRRF